MPECGLTEELLSGTDVLVWWGHAAHERVSDGTADCVKAHVLRGMGLIALHSAHFCKPLKLLLGTGMTLKWKECGRERLFTVAPFHPIAAGVPERTAAGRSEADQKKSRVGSGAENFMPRLPCRELEGSPNDCRPKSAMLPSERFLRQARGLYADRCCPCRRRLQPRRRLPLRYRS